MMEQLRLCQESGSSSRFLWSLKGNQQFSDIIDSIVEDGNDRGVEIEFESFDQAIIHVNQTQFVLKLSDIDHFDVFSTNSETELLYVGLAEGRFTITNIFKHGSAKQSLPSIVRNTLLHSSNQHEKKRSIAQIDEPTNRNEDFNENLDILNDSQSANEKRLKKQYTKKPEKKSLQKMTPSENIISFKHESFQIKFLPMSMDISINNILTLFSGLKIHQVYVSLQSGHSTASESSETINKSRSNTRNEIPSHLSIVVYIAFDSLSGVELGYMRNGEVLSYQTTTEAKGAKKVQIVQLYPVTRLESIWVEAIALPMYETTWTSPEQPSTHSATTMSNTMSIRTLLQSIPMTLLDEPANAPSTDTVSSFPWQSLQHWLRSPEYESLYWLEKYMAFCTTRNPSSHVQHSAPFAILLLQTYKTMNHDNLVEDMWRSYVPTIPAPATEIIAAAEEEESIEGLCGKIAGILHEVCSLMSRFHWLSHSTGHNIQHNYEYWMNYLQRRKIIYEVLFYRIWKVQILSHSMSHSITGLRKK